MKIRKTRIKKTTKANGSVQYVAEYKWGFWWYQFDDCMGPCGHARNTYYDWVVKTKKSSSLFTWTEQSAKGFIDFYMERVKYQNACEVENEVVKVEYEGYP